MLATAPKYFVKIYICYVFALLLLFSTNIASIAQQQKIRLPQSINSHQPTLLPIIAPDGRTLFFDRKWHKDNTGGVRDDDEIWYSALDSNNQWSKARKLEGNLNLSTSNALLYIFPSGEKALVYGEYPNGNSPFWIARRFGNEWKLSHSLKIRNYYNKSKSYSATISSDERVLLLSLERDDGLGGLDIYISFYNDTTNEYSEPRNLGAIVNSQGIDFVSFLAFDNQTLYFASNRKPNGNDLDLFFARRMDDSWLNWSFPIPMDSVLNTSADENSVSFNILGDTAYFVSKDTDGAGIFLAELPSSYRPQNYVVISGTISEKDKPENLIRHPVEFEIHDFERDFEFKDTIHNGKFCFVVPYNTQYNFFVRCSGYEPISFSTSSANIRNTFIQNYDISLVKEKPFGFGLMTSPQITHLKTVYFETNIDTLDTFEKQKLMDLKNFIMQNPNSQLLVVGHTDETGTNEYNMNLSIRRAKNTANLLQNLLNFDISKIKIEGKGKSEPASATDLSKNRRVEIFLIENE